jgi:hypothetical protein
MPGTGLACNWCCGLWLRGANALMVFGQSITCKNIKKIIKQNFSNK